MKPAEARERDDGLAENPHLIRLAGPLGGLRFPALCPSCGAAARQGLEIAKAFMRTGGTDQLRRFEIARAHVPFCPSCIAEHRRELDPLTVTERLLSMLRSELAWPGLGLAALGVFFATQMSHQIASDPKGSLPLVALLVVLFSTAGVCLKAAWNKGERFRLPAPTRITSSFDFGDDQSNDFGTYARLYSIRDARFAEAFAHLNRDTSDQLLGPGGKARTNRNFILGLLLLALVVVLSALFQSE
jgi:hypothetical protein